MITHDIGRLYWQVYPVQSGAPLLRRVSTYSYQPPYRWSRSLVVRYWPGHAVEVGWWRNPVNPKEDAVDSLIRAVQGQGLYTVNGYRDKGARAFETETWKGQKQQTIAMRDGTRVPLWGVHELLEDQD